MLPKCSHFTFNERNFKQRHKVSIYTTRAEFKSRIKQRFTCCNFKLTMKFGHLLELSIAVAVASMLSLCDQF